jgi:hypothetical protein
VSGFWTSFSPSETTAAVVTAADVTITAGIATHPLDTMEPRPKERASKTVEKTLR